ILRSNCTARYTARLRLSPFVVRVNTGTCASPSRRQRIFYLNRTRLSASTLGCRPSQRSRTAPKWRAPACTNKRRRNFVVRNVVWHAVRRVQIAAARQFTNTSSTQRLDHQHKLARMLVNQYGFIAIEDLNVRGLAGGMLSKQVLDASWSSFIAKLTYKAEDAGRQLVKVDPRGTSQRCPCGANVPKKLSDREHACTKCGLITTRDHASAAEILRLGLSLQSLTVVQECCRGLRSPRLQAREKSPSE